MNYQGSNTAPVITGSTISGNLGDIGGGMSFEGV